MHTNESHLDILSRVIALHCIYIRPYSERDKDEILFFSSYDSPISLCWQIETEFQMN